MGSRVWPIPLASAIHIFVEVALLVSARSGLGSGKHQLDLFWHVNPELLPTENNRAAFAGADIGLSIVTPEGHGWTQEIESEDWSPAYGQKERHGVVRLSTAATLPAEFASLLIPHAQGRSSGGSFARVESVRRVNLSSAIVSGREDASFCFCLGSPWTLFR
jgi:hypothetical protein